MSEKLTPEEIMAKLKAVGLDPSKWAECEPGEIHPPFAQKQAELLTQMRDLLEEGLEEKRRKLATLQETLTRVKHGGGM
mgnify:CR=1 FL=1